MPEIKYSAHIADRRQWPGNPVLPRQNAVSMTLAKNSEIKTVARHVFELFYMRQPIVIKPFKHIE